MIFFMEIKKKSPNLYGTTEGPKHIRAILRKKNKTEDITLPDFYLYHKAIVTKMVCIIINFRLMVQNRELRKKPMHIWSINLWQKSQEYTGWGKSKFRRTLCPLDNMDGPQGHCGKWNFKHPSNHSFTEPLNSSYSVQCTTERDLRGSVQKHELGSQRLTTLAKKSLIPRLWTN